MEPSTVIRPPGVTSPTMMSVLRTHLLSSSMSRAAILRNPSCARMFSFTIRMCRDETWLKRGPVTYQELKPYTETPSGHITLIDVREPNEVSQGMIPASVNVPLSEFKAAFNPENDAPASTDFERKYSFPRPKFNDPIIFYCRSGRRSQQALEEAQKHGWWNTRNYTGSWIDWVAQEQSNKKDSDEDE